MGFHTFVAVGDSCAEGLDDPYPDHSRYRGWADYVAGPTSRATKPRSVTPISPFAVSGWTRSPRSSCPRPSGTSRT